MVLASQAARCLIATFRAQLSAAPLKLSRRVPHLVLAEASFRAQLSAAPLKQLVTRMASILPNSRIPRSIERGPVEASAACGCSGGVLVSFRAQLSAAPLKQLAVADVG